jgi:integrase
MARKPRDSTLESRTARLRLAPRYSPYSGPTLARGIKLLYRRNQTNGAWIVKAADGHGKYWTKAFAIADDYEDADAAAGILTFYQAQDAAKKLARHGDAPSADAPVTVAGALDDYACDLGARGASPTNANYPRKHLTSTLLSKPVALLSQRELRLWRDSLLAKLKASSVNRIIGVFATALSQAAERDHRIKNQQAWLIGLATLPDAHTARNVVLPDATVSAFVSAAYAHDSALGLLVDTLAVTGARPSQAVRLHVGDLHDGDKPKLMMPKSGKGGGANRVQRKLQTYSVPITPALAAKLKQAALGRDAEAPLFLRSNGEPWNARPSHDYREDIRTLVDGIGLPGTVTIYALRHSSIVRQLLANVPVRIVAAVHNTSVQMIESTYSAHISEYSDELSRSALLHHTPPPTDNVVPIATAMR